MKLFFSKNNNVIWLLFITIFNFPFCVSAQEDKDFQKPYQETVIHEGIKVAFSMEHIDAQKPPAIFQEGDDVRFRFSISDTLTNNGLSGAFPAAWMDIVPEEDVDCAQKVSSFITGSILNEPVLNLNVYYVLTLNKEPTITVVDPLFGYGGTQLLALIELNSPGIDWVLTEDQNFVFVAMPEARQIAVINTASWKVVNNIDLPAKPYELLLQPDEQYLWVACQEEGDKSGVAAINLQDQKLQKFIPTGKGTHAMTVTKESDVLFVTNKMDDNISVIDVRSLAEIKKLPVGKNPVALTYSPHAEAVYILSETDGTMIVVDAKKQEQIANIQLDPGISQVRFEPGQRFAFVVNPLKDIIYIVDASNNKLVQIGDMESQPDQVSFSDELAYVRHRNSELVLMIPLKNIGVKDQPITVVDFPAGMYPPGKMTAPCLADGIVQTPGESAVLVANAPDKTIYYYSEGMAAPMGNFNNYNQEPLAVMVIDRSLQESTPGNYETIVKLRGSGVNDIAFFMDVPRFVHCFRVNILPDPKLEMNRTIDRMGGVMVEHLPPRRYIIAGEEFPVNFRLADIKSKKIRSDLTDVQIMCMGSSGLWHCRKNVEVDSDGNYATKMIFPEVGVYYLYVGTPSGGLSLSNPQYRTVHVIEHTSSN